MENESPEIGIPYEFLKDKKLKEVFARIDYLLRSGVHIQREYPSPPDLYRFIDKYFDKGLKDYYYDIFNINLRKEGADFNTYFFVDFNENGRSNIPSENKDTLNTEWLLIGMLFFKFYKLDGHIELESISDFTKLLFSEYDEEKEALRRLFADVANNKGTDYSDEKIVQEIKLAFKKFDTLGWIAWENQNEKDRFIFQPSFERLRNMYQDQILGIDELLKPQQDEK